MASSVVSRVRIRGKRDPVSQPHVAGESVPPVCDDANRGGWQLSVGVANWTCYIHGFGEMTVGLGVDSQNLGSACGNQENGKRSAKTGSQKATYACSDSASQEIVQIVARFAGRVCEPAWPVILDRYAPLRGQSGDCHDSCCAVFSARGNGGAAMRRGRPGAGCSSQAVQPWRRWVA